MINNVTPVRLEVVNGGSYEEYGLLRRNVMYSWQNQIFLEKIFPPSSS